MDSGDFVPDAVTNEMVWDRLREEDAESGFLLDGYPRTTDQMDYLDSILNAAGTELSAVLQLVAPDNELTSRLLARAAESGRTDDTENVIKTRLKLYHQETQLVVSRYSARGSLIEVAGIGSVDDVTERALNAIKATNSARPLMA